MKIFEVIFTHNKTKIGALIFKAPNLKRAKIYARFEKEVKNYGRCATAIKEVEY